MPTKIINKTCDYCNTIIKYNTGWSKHIKTKKHIKKKKEYEEQKEEIKKSEQQDLYCDICDITIKNYRSWDRHLKSKSHLRNKEVRIINNTTNNNTINSNNTTNNNTINITMNNFGDEKIDFDPEFFEKFQYLGTTFEMKKLLSETIFNKEENKTLIKTNMRDNFIKKRVNDKWNTAPLKKTINERIDNIQKLFINNLLNLIKKLENNNGIDIMEDEYITDKEYNLLYYYFICDAYNNRYLLNNKK